MKCKPPKFEFHEMGLGGKLMFVDLTRIGLVMRRRQVGFPASWNGFLSIYSFAWPISECSWLLGQAHEHMLMEPEPGPNDYVMRMSSRHWHH